MEWQRLHPGIDAILSHRKSNYTEKLKESDDEGNDSSIDSSDENTVDNNKSVPKKRNAPVKKTVAIRGGRGRGTTAPTLSMYTDPSMAPSFAPSSSAKWPPRG
jgi:hypothetical protein